MNASLIERLLGTILADITASDLPSLEKRPRLAFCLKLLEHYTKSYLNK